MSKRFAGSAVVLSLVLGLVGPANVFAATAPTLGVASGYSVFGNAGITETPAQTSHLWGNVGDNGFGHASLIASQVDGTIEAVANVPVANAIAAAYGELAGQGQTGAIDLATSPTVTPGVYNVAATAFSSTLTLSGAGVYIFRSTSSIAQTAGGTMSLTNGATACNVFWQIPTDMTFAAAGSIAGTIITNTGLISFVSGVNLQGRAWAHTQVTMSNNQITEPTCVTPSTGSSQQEAAGTITVVKVVTNDNGRTNRIEDFPLFMNATPVVSGETNTFFPAAAYDITETSNLAQYTRAFSGDCDANGRLNLNAGDAKVCIITNDDIGAPVAVPPVPPLIDVIKVPSPLALPNGPGAVQYTYTLRNVGTVPVTDITMVGDTCAPIVRVSGDVNGDNKLDVNETWVHTCSTNLTQTHTNVVTVTGWANGISTVDIANATVVVGAPIVPPLIHITKTPSKFALLAGGGMITYTKKVTNPGIVPLSNVILTDSQCSSVKFVSGDTNNDAKLDVNETWTYTCAKTLTKTTTNTAYVSGTANGMTARDFAIATVVVAAAVPVLPKTGLAPTESALAWGVAAASLLVVSLLLYTLRKKQNV